MIEPSEDVNNIDSQCKKNRRGDKRSEAYRFDYLYNASWAWRLQEMARRILFLYF